MYICLHVCMGVMTGGNIQLAGGGNVLDPKTLWSLMTLWALTTVSLKVPTIECLVFGHNGSLEINWAGAISCNYLGDYAVCVKLILHRFMYVTMATKEVHHMKRILNPYSFPISQRTLVVWSVVRQLGWAAEATRCELWQACKDGITHNQKQVTIAEPPESSFGFINVTLAM